MNKKIIICIETLIIIVLIVILFICYKEKNNNSTSFYKEYKIAEFNRKFTYYRKSKKGFEIKELLNDVLNNIKENKNDDAKLPDIFYLAKDSEANMKSKLNEAIKELNDDDIQDILDIEVFESYDNFFEFNFDKEKSFKIVSDSKNTNVDLIEKVMSNIEDEKDYYVAFKNNLGQNADGLISVIIINEL